ncbi:enolase [Streptomyces avermitilis]|uniref:Enolase-phosphatase E1 n=2 Tax=Streptomyces avermitilis TaxID=33903 RepID=MTNC_STRAW|nr:MULTISPECIES: acireductone synthase [Streptomyces]Q828K9.1 RecName: Full=Enolase-phosphatase E1; AltName: Full=2,3-diketo-5-methylthio-1-phosphopentane phosphatase [Streptomyces avermitilis MA-4680 = NBRC 14893]KUN53788.1 enolase [Streptomyces avermitilis]MYT02202.1 acireductone synthase [Streptomyces sp. SID5469]OOV27220.1 acireductone synthase [Streptomyces avermitilis]BAC74371.1 putative enolase-phosphatase E-1 [Streptomyces avermitilis MA-4680 = NBRC 14893]BBJ54927.1 enolase-phosphatas
MSSVFDIDSVVLDIEGTTSATGFVVDVLYPYSRSRFGALLTERSGDPEVARAVAQVRELLGEPDADAVRVEKALNEWLDDDRKATPLKTLQGLVWSEGFARGELVSHFYDDVVPALRAWHAAGVRLHVYSSGSVAAQRAWFRSSPEGDLLPLVEGLYDTENAGPKQEPESYRTIAAALGTGADRILFLSDRPGELDAARAAGWRTVGVRRPGEPYYEQGVGDHAQAGSFGGITIARSTA